MIYVQMVNGKPEFSDVEAENCMVIDDVFENVFLYSYDKDSNKISKKTGIEYEVKEVNGQAVITFLTSQPVYFNAEYRYGRVRVDEQGFAYSNGETAELKLNIELNGFMIITSLMPDHNFIPIEIISEDKVSDEILPSIRCIDGEITVKKSVYYREIDMLKEEIRKLKGE